MARIDGVLKWIDPSGVQLPTEAIASSNLGVADTANRKYFGDCGILIVKRIPTNDRNFQRKEMFLDSRQCDETTSTSPIRRAGGVICAGGECFL